MNDRGASFSGNRKISSVTGQEEIFDTPVQTITGDDISSSSSSINVSSSSEGVFERSIKVNGGPGNKSTSEFNGPVIINNKLTSTSSKGIEASSLFLQGDTVVSRRYTVGISTPVIAGNPGDVIYYDNPTKGNYLGWVYTTDNGWYRFGNVGLAATANINTFDNIGIGTTTPGNSLLKINNIFDVNSSSIGISTANTQGYRLFVNGNTNVSGALTATYFYGDGSYLTNLNASSTGWTNISGGIYNTSLNRVGIGTSVPRFNLEVGSVGSSSTTLYVNGEAKFADILIANNALVSGMLTATALDLQAASGKITAGIVTAITLSVGSGGTTITTSGPSVGIGTLSPRAKLDIEGHTRFKTYSENVEALSIVSNVVTIDLSKAQTFTLTVSSQINQFTLINSPTASTSFTIKILQGSTPYSVGIDTFRTSGGSTIPVYWPGGGVVPIVTNIANRTDMYSFKTFDGGLSLFGVIGGQNFA